jgi:acyl-CoA reductase-like NAD-dependent aldehyde dehydrogenase
LQVYDEVLQRLKKAYQQTLNRIGDALDDKTLIGPLHSKQSLQKYQNTIAEIKKQGGTIEFGGKVIVSFCTWTLLQINLNCRQSKEADISSSLR